MKQKSRHQTFWGFVLVIVALITAGLILQDTVKDVRTQLGLWCTAQCCGCDMSNCSNPSLPCCSCTHVAYDFDTQECVIGRHTAFTKPERYKYECNLTYLNGVFQP